MTDQEKQKATELLITASKVPEEKRDFLMGYMQCMVDMDEKSNDNDKRE